MKMERPAKSKWKGSSESLAFRRRPEEYHAKGSENDGKDEDASPAEAGCNGAAREGCDAAASPGADRPEAQGSLAGFPFEIGIHEGNGRRHDACGRQTLNDAARDEEHRALRKDEAGRADDAQDKSQVSNLLPTGLIRQTSGSHDEEAREKSRQADRNIQRIQRNPKIRLHGRSDIHDGLREKPERNHAKNNPGDHPVCPFIPHFHTFDIPSSQTDFQKIR